MHINYLFIITNKFFQNFITIRLGQLFLINTECAKLITQLASINKLTHLIYTKDTT